VISGSDLVLTEVGVGTSVVSVCVNDGEYNVCDEITVNVIDVNLAPVSDCQILKDTSALEDFGTLVLEFCSVFSDPDGDVLEFTAVSSMPGVAGVSVDGCELTITEVSPGTTTVSLCASDGEFQSCCNFDFTVIERNVLEIYLLDQELAEGDTIINNREAGSVTLIVYSDIEWTAATPASWINLTKTNQFNLEVEVSEYTGQSERSGKITIADAQENEISFVAYQSDVTGFDTHLHDNNRLFEIYPNPVTGTFVLKSNVPDYSIATIETLSLDGRICAVIDRQKIIEGRITIDMTDHKPGLYILKITDKNGINTSLPVMKR
jgi:hypothetical protein